MDRHADRPMAGAGWSDAFTGDRDRDCCARGERSLSGSVLTLVAPCRASSDTYRACDGGAVILVPGLVAMFVSEQYDPNDVSKQPLG